MTRYIRLLGTFLRASLLAELEYRANFVSQSLLGVLWAGISVASATVFYTQTDLVGGWRYEQTLIVIGLFVVSQGVIQFLLYPNLSQVVSMVREGTMDFVLVKPVDSQFLSSLRYMRYSGLSDLLTGVIIVGAGLTLSGARLDLLAGLMFIASLAAALAILYSIWLAMSALSFWFVQIDNLAELFNSAFDTARVPVTAYQGALRFALTFVVPIAFITTVPAQAALDMLDRSMLVVGLGIAVGALLSSRWLWLRALRNYSSASS